MIVPLHGWARRTSLFCSVFVASSTFLTQPIVKAAGNVAAPLESFHVPYESPEIKAGMKFLTTGVVKNADVRNDSTGPEVAAALRWLREHQSSDGSWALVTDKAESPKASCRHSGQKAKIHKRVRLRRSRNRK